MTRIARNLAIDWLRRGRRASRVLPLVSLSNEALQVADAGAKGARDVMASEEQIESLREAIHRLPAAGREVILLHFAEECTQGQIAVTLGLSQATVSRRIREALASLRLTLEPDLRNSIPALRAPSRAVTGSVGVAVALGAMPATSRAEIAALGLEPVGAMGKVLGACAASSTLLSFLWSSLASRFGGVASATAAAIVIGLSLTLLVSGAERQRTVGVSVKMATWLDLTIGQSWRDLIDLRISSTGGDALGLMGGREHIFHLQYCNRLNEIGPNGTLLIERYTRRVRHRAGGSGIGGFEVITSPVNSARDSLVLQAVSPQGVVLRQTGDTFGPDDHAWLRLIETVNQSLLLAALEHPQAVEREGESWEIIVPVPVFGGELEMVSTFLGERDNAGEPIAVISRAIRAELDFGLSRAVMEGTLESRHLVNEGLHLSTAGVIEIRSTAAGSGMESPALVIDVEHSPIHMGTTSRRFWRSTIPDGRTAPAIALGS